MTPKRRAFSTPTIAGLTLAAFVLAAVVIGIVLLDSPATERLRRLDERRVSDLVDLSYGIDAYWTREQTLPPTLDALSGEFGASGLPVDPETGAPYEYSPSDTARYTLCASFAESSSNEYSTPYKDVWSHPAGRYCYQLAASEVPRDPYR